MLKRVLVLAVGLLLAVGLAGPAQASSRHGRPSKPRDVVVRTVGQEPGAVEVAWRAPKHQGSGAVEAYAVTSAQASSPSRRSWTVVGAEQRSVVLRGLEPGRHVVEVAAYNRWGRGPWAAARVEVGPAKHAEALFAVDEHAHTVVRFALPVPSSGTSAPTTVLTGVTDVDDLEVDAAGNAYVAAGGTVTKVPPTGAPTTVGPGTQVETDAAGDVYLGSAAGVTEIGRDGKRTTITPDPGYNLAVDGQGAVTVSTWAFGHGNTLTTFAPGVAPRVRTISLNGGRILGDRLGTTYIAANSAGAARFSYWVRVAPGSSEAGSLGTRQAEYGATVAPDDSFYLAESGSACPAISEDTGSCTPNREVLSIARYAPDGHLVSDVPTSGFKTRRSGGVDVAVDSKGALYAADRGDGDPAALVRVPPGGGPAQRVAAGEYALPTVG